MHQFDCGLCLVDHEPVARRQGAAAAARGGVDAVQETLVVIDAPFLGPVLQK